MAWLSAGWQSAGKVLLIGRRGRLFQEVDEGDHRGQVKKLKF
jgi:hypothetical protein